MKCVFCDILACVLPAEIIWTGDGATAFLDNTPLFPGHILLVPDQHIETLADLPSSQVGSFFQIAQKLERAVESVMGAQGSFVAINNRVSQSVPHLHVHIVPRSKGDGLKGFFWPRRKYESDEHIHEIADKLRSFLTG